jgi:hypothetical protein
MKKNEILAFTSKWMELENIILSEVNQAQFLLLIKDTYLLENRFLKLYKTYFFQIEIFIYFIYLVIDFFFSQQLK